MICDDCQSVSACSHLGCRPVEDLLAVGYAEMPAPTQPLSFVPVQVPQHRSLWQRLRDWLGLI